MFLLDKLSYLYLYSSSEAIIPNIYADKTNHIFLSCHFPRLLLRAGKLQSMYSVSFERHKTRYTIAATTSQAVANRTPDERFPNPCHIRSMFCLRKPFPVERTTPHAKKLFASDIEQPIWQPQ